MHNAFTSPTRRILPVWADSASLVSALLANCSWDSLCCDAADMESFLTVLNSFNIHIFAGGQGSWVEPNGRHYAPLPRLPWQEDDVAEVPQ